MNLDMLTLSDNILPVACAICLCIGYILKKWVKDVDDKFIPTILACVGLILAVWINSWTITPVIVLQGVLSGLSATGLHQMFKQYIERGDKA